MNKLFEVHKLNNVGMENAQAIANLFNELLDQLADICPCGREFSIAQTKLEEAAFFAKKSMAKLEENQQENQHDGDRPWIIETYYKGSNLPWMQSENYGLNGKFETREEAQEALDEYDDGMTRRIVQKN